MKAKYTRQYDLSLTDREMFMLVRAFDTYVKEFAVPEEYEELLGELREAFLGELPQPPGDPLEPVAV